jgi:hypothetical protein
MPHSGIDQDTRSGKQPYYFTARDGSPALTIARRDRLELAQAPSHRPLGVVLMGRGVTPLRRTPRRFLF